MSDVSMLSHEYKTASELSELVNRALIALKKERLGLLDPLTPAPVATEEDRQHLIGILATLRSMLSSQEAADGGASIKEERVPGTLVARIREERRGDLSYYLDDVERAADSLRRRTPATDQDLRILDQLAAAADAETSGVFRQLMRK